jgi:uncharacterized protein (TIGR00730 family)
MKRVCVFCGSSTGAHPVYLEAARHLGRRLAERGLGLVYGGASVGLMGALADEALAAGGEVVGVITRPLMDREIGHPRLTRLEVVETMHERKARMAELADAFAVLPGGIGTLEEFFEVWTWGYLGLHRKPCGLLDVNGYYAPLRQLVDHMVAERFLREETRKAVLFSSGVDELLEWLTTYEPPPVERVVGRGQV